jgi:hypothetical protein
MKTPNKIERTNADLKRKSRSLVGRVRNSHAFTPKTQKPEKHRKRIGEDS